jgi:hypothetical protein
MRFRAFLSYSHADAVWARWLLHRLETYRVPSRLVGTQGAHGEIGARLGTFFRDRDELPSSGDLGTTIREALGEASALIVICSPAAAQSRWVNAEVETFRASSQGDHVLCFVVGGDPGSIDPAQQCFPPAVLARRNDDRAIEPLAADARREGDGRERALLKLVAGLLGIGYDRLARREAQRRQRKWAAVAAASVAGMAITLVLAATAWIARNDAQRRQAQAEDILGFMLGDLRGKLTTVGRLDLMRAVDDKATHYFAALDPRDLSDRSLEEQARSLTGIGQVRLDEGDHDAAMSAFREAHARSSALYLRDPQDGQRLFDRAQAEYWIGYVALQQGRFDDTETWFRQYRDSAIRLAAMDRSNFGWQREAAYGDQNLATVDEKRGHFAQAEQKMRSVRSQYRQWLLQRPGDVSLRYEDANNASWLGSLALRQGNLTEAEGFYSEQADAMRVNMAQEPKNVQWQEIRSEALLMLADAQAARGRIAPARSSLEDARAIVEQLSRLDPANNDWLTTAGICRWRLAQLALLSGAPQADALAAQAAALLGKAHTVEPKSERVLRWLVKARDLQAQLALSHGDAAAAKLSLAASYALLEPAWKSRPNEALRQVLADNRVLAGEAAQLSNESEMAVAAWQQAKQLLSGGAGEEIPFERLDPLVRTLQHLGRANEAETYEQRLALAGYVPMRPFPVARGIAAR